MEPVLGGRDDLPRLQPITRGCGAAMEPVLGGRDDRLAERWDSPAHPPQWSPSLADGTTGLDDQPAAPAQQAAMEPVLGGRDDGTFTSRTPTARWRRNGARPWRTGRLRYRLSDRVAYHRRNGARPWRTGRPCRRQWAASCETGRNGARPWRTGRRVVALVRRLRGSVPQWSPSLADGTTRQGHPGLLARRDAAMEPVLGGRDDHRSSGSRPGHPCRRNGARPWRTGRRRGGSG